MYRAIFTPNQNKENKNVPGIKFLLLESEEKMKKKNTYSYSKEYKDF